MCKLVKPSVEKPWLKYFSEEARGASVPQNTIYRHLRENNENGCGDTQIENLKEKLYRGIATRADITRVTRKLGDEIAHVYGFPIPRRWVPVQER